MVPKKKLKSVTKTLKLEKPKQPSSAFIFFQKEKRKEVAEKNKDVGFNEMSGILSDMWKELPEEEKEYYDELSKYDKCRFKEEKRLYRQQFYKKLSKALQDGTVQPSEIEQKIIPPAKQAGQPYQFFSSHVRPMLRAHGEQDKPKLISKPLRVMFDSMNQVQRIPFDIMYKEDEERNREERLQNSEINSFINP